jgi:hypothetical protein
MEKKGALTKILTIAGLALVWFPVLAPILFSVLRTIRGGIFHFDYLTVAEFFPVVLLGGALLTWAALRARSYRRLIGLGFGIAVGLLVFSMLLATLTGLASGETEPAGLGWALVLGAIILYSVLVVVIGIGGLMLLRGLFKPSLGS